MRGARHELHQGQGAAAAVRRADDHGRPCRQPASGRAVHDAHRERSGTQRNGQPRGPSRRPAVEDRDYWPASRRPPSPKRSSASRPRACLTSTRPTSRRSTASWPSCLPEPGRERGLPGNLSPSPERASRHARDDPLPGQDHNQCDRNGQSTTAASMTLCTHAMHDRNLCVNRVTECCPAGSWRTRRGPCLTCDCYGRPDPGIGYSRRGGRGRAGDGRQYPAPGRPVRSKRLSVR